MYGTGAQQELGGGGWGEAGADSLDVVSETSQAVGAVKQQGVGTRFPGGGKGH